MIKQIKDENHRKVIRGGKNNKQLEKAAKLMSDKRKRQKK
jgi:pyruvate-formate lyase-activating enzyme